MTQLAERCTLVVCVAVLLAVAATNLSALRAVEDLEVRSVMKLGAIVFLLVAVCALLAGMMVARILWVTS